jgi:hypothetical protein
VHDFPHAPQFEGSRWKSAHEFPHVENPAMHEPGPVSGFIIEPSGISIEVSDEHPAIAPAVAPAPMQRRITDNRNVFMRISVV